ncbi:unnamed protein product, partial [Urochloa humidicola]
PVFGSRNRRRKPKPHLTPVTETDSCSRGGAPFFSRPVRRHHRRLLPHPAAPTTLHSNPPRAPSFRRIARPRLPRRRAPAPHRPPGIHLLLRVEGLQEHGTAASMTTMKFCRECNNILYPKEDRDKRTLFFACRNCEHQEVSDNNCVYRNEVHHTAGERTQVLQDVASDPTLPRTKNVRCALCGHGEAVFFQATARGEEGMTLFFVCCSPDCGHRWRE